MVTFIGKPVFSVAEEKCANNGKIGYFALSFAKKYVNSGLLKADRKLLIVRFGIGGTGFKKGDFVQDWKNKNLSDCTPITEKIKSVIKRIGNAAFVETDGLLSNDEKNANADDIHFCREALYELGERYFQAFLEIKSGYNV